MKITWRAVSVTDVYFDGLTRIPPQEAYLLGKEEACLKVSG
jgi:hypothetical protein